MKLRPATPDDAALIFEWANDPVTRANSAVNDPIEWDDHVRWFESKLASDDAALWIGVDDDGMDVGLVRFEGSVDEVEIGVNVAPGHRGGGTGTALIEAGCEEFVSLRETPLIVAHIRHENVASQRAFEKAGFKPAGEEEARGVLMLRYERGG